jgi:peptidoglycan/LPS O-acetylase OafA/YrhL
MLEASKPRFAILDPLRFVAALAVLMYHYSIYLDESSVVLQHMMKFGYLGVNFFFMLSGFVIMASAQNRTAREFIAARAMRIYPAFIICLAFTLLLAWLLKGETTAPLAVLANAAILNDYFAIPNVDGVYWTLQAELKFYGCVFLLLVTGLFQFWRFWLSAWLVAAIAYYFLHQPFFLSWFINPQYSFYFIGGICAYLINKDKQDHFTKLVFLLSGVFAVILAREQTNNFMETVSVLERNLAAGLVLMIFLFFYGLAQGKFNVKSSANFVLLGSISYPLYLIHSRSGKNLIDYFWGDIGVTAIALVVVLLIILSLGIVKFEGYSVSAIKRIAKRNLKP